MTTLSPDGRVNVAPMGPIVSHPSAMQTADSGDPGFVFRPYVGSQTFDNLNQTGRATIHVTDDAGLIARAAVRRLDSESVPIRMIRDDAFAVLRDCHRWFAVEVTEVRQTPPRYEMRTKVVASAIEAPFFGFNRAKHAVLEAAILATRTRMLPTAEVRSQLDALRPLVEKTAGQLERDAFAMLCREIDDRINQDGNVGPD